MTLLLLLVGLALILFGADALVDGSSTIARRLKISEFVIGLTIVGFGTSCPELVVSVTGAFAGNADISIGNVLGSNIFNTLCILGVTSLIIPISITKTNRNVDIPMVIFATVITLVLGLNATIFGVGANTLTRLDGVILLLFFAAYIVFCFKSQGDVAEESTQNAPQKSLFVAILFTLGGLAGLIFGGDLFVKSATKIAQTLGVSDKFIAITVLAGGTSLPELATCIAAAAKKKNQLALGNILGSNIFNLLLILGCSSLITPLSFASLNVVDVAALLFSTLLLFLFACTGRKISLNRVEGGLLLLSFIAYYVYLFIKL